jgi:hypothetical protein
MPYVTTVEPAGIEKGLRQGMEQGDQIRYRKGEADLLLWLIFRAAWDFRAAGI